jgi:hypothetical protein
MLHTKKYRTRISVSTGVIAMIPSRTKTDNITAQQASETTTANRL